MQPLTLADPSGRPTILGPDGTPLAGLPARADPDGGGFALPHVYTFASIVSSASKGYSWRWDEAMRRSREDALAMRRDAFLMGILAERKRAVTRLKWHLAPDDPHDARQAEVAGGLTRIVQSIPHFRRYRAALLEALWYGRYGVQMVLDWSAWQGRRVFTCLKHRPVNGDKIQYRWDGVPRVLVHAGKYGALEEQGASIVPTDRGLALELDGPYWRERFCIHQHEVDDADYFDGEMAGAVEGVGIRSRLYWLDWLRKEFLGNVVDFMEKIGLGVTIYYYESGNDQSREAAEKAAKEQSENRTIILWPRMAGQARDAAGVERIEVPASGSEILLRLQEHIEKIEERYIIGQSASSKSETSGLGTHDTELQAATKAQITEEDAENLDETLTGSAAEPGLVWVLKKYNYPDADFPVRFVSAVQQTAPEKKLAAAEKVYSMGIAVDADEVRGAAGLSRPAEGADVVQRQAPAQPAAVPGGPGEPRDGRPLPFGAEGRWVTIGGREGADGKKHGGSPVYIENGRIIKGHPSLTGKKVGSLAGNPGHHRHTREQFATVQPSVRRGRFNLRTPAGDFVRGKPTEQSPAGPVRDYRTAEEAEAAKADIHRRAVRAALLGGLDVPAAVLAQYPDLAERARKREPGGRKQQAQSGAYARALWGKKARQEGLDPQALHQLAGEFRAHDAAHVADRTRLLQEARRVSRDLGHGDLTSLKARSARGGVDADSFRGLDDVAERMAERYPEQFAGHADAQERLYSLLAEGNPEPMAEDDAYGQAFDYLVQEAERDRYPVTGDEDDAVPFGRQSLPLPYAAYGAHAPRGGVTVNGKHYPGGQWVPAAEVAAAPEHEREAFKQAVGHACVHETGYFARYKRHSPFHGGKSPEERAARKAEREKAQAERRELRRAERKAERRAERDRERRLDAVNQHELAVLFKEGDVGQLLRGHSGPDGRRHARLADLAEGLARADVHADPAGYRAALGRVQGFAAAWAAEVATRDRERLDEADRVDHDDLLVALREIVRESHRARKLLAGLGGGPEHYRRRLGPLRYAYNPAERRVPAGQPGGGRWAGGSGEAAARLARANLKRIDRSRGLQKRADYLWERTLAHDVLGHGWEHVGPRNGAADVVNREPLRLQSGHQVNVILDGKLITAAAGRVQLKPSSRVQKVLEGDRRGRPAVVTYLVLHDGPDVPADRKGVYLHFGSARGFSLHGGPSDRFHKLKAVKGVADLGDPKRRKRLRKEILAKLDALDVGQYQAASEAEAAADADGLADVLGQLGMGRTGENRGKLADKLEALARKLREPEPG